MARLSWPTRALVILLGILSALVLVIYSWKIGRNPDYTDFWVYHRAGLRLLEGDYSHLYDFRLDGKSPYRYAPPTLALWLPWALLPRGISQVLWFYFNYVAYALGFRALYRSLRSGAIEPDRALRITVFSALFVLRFCLDSFTIGQVTGVMFWCGMEALRTLLQSAETLTGVWLAIPTAFKLGPGLLYFSPPWLSTRAAWRKRIGGAIAPALGLTALLTLWMLARPATESSTQIAAPSSLAAATGSAWPAFAQVWRDWVLMLTHNADYFDTAHYGSQSLQSALMRAANAQGGSREGWMRAWEFGAALGVAAVVLAFARPRNRSALGLGRTFCAGWLAYLLFMPFTFKYSMPFLAAPLAFALAGPLSVKRVAWIGLGALTLSLAGLDIIGPSAFFWLQTHSVPLVWMLGFAAFYAADLLQPATN